MLLNSLTGLSNERKAWRSVSIVGVLFCLLWPASWKTPVATAQPDASPEQFFQTYIQREASYDKSLADLYSDEALIQVKRVLPGGEDWTEYIPALHYKAMLRQLMPLAKVSQDASEYTLLKQQPEKKNRVRLKIRRLDRVGEYESPLELVIGPNPVQPSQWVIYEERSEIHTATNLQ